MFKINWIHLEFKDPLKDSGASAFVCPCNEYISALMGLVGRAEEAVNIKDVPLKAHSWPPHLPDAMPR